MYHVEEILADGERLQLLKEAVESPGRAALMRSAKFKLTHRCNLRCKMCGIWKYAPQGEMGTERTLQIIEDLARLGCRKIHFSGGEPLMRDDIFELIERCRRLKVRANLTTNGTLVTREAAKKLVKAGARSVSISIDGATKKTHDAARGVEGAFKAAVSAIERLAWARQAYANGKPLKIRVNTVLGRHNWREMPQIIRLAGELGADDVHPMPVDTKSSARRPSKAQMKDYNLCVATESRAMREKYGFSAAQRLIYPYGLSKQDLQYSRRGEYALGFYERNPCYVPWLHIFIAWDGNVYPCCMTRGRVPPLGDAGRYNAEDIFFGPGYASLRKSILHNRYRFCHNCDNFLIENRILKEALEGPPECRSADSSLLSAL